MEKMKKVKKVKEMEEMKRKDGGIRSCFAANE